MPPNAITQDALKEQYDILFDSTPCFVTIIDRNFHILHANRKFRRSGRGAFGRLPKASNPAPSIDS